MTDAARPALRVGARPASVCSPLPDDTGRRKGQVPTCPAAEKCDDGQAQPLNQLAAREPTSNQSEAGNPGKPATKRGLLLSWLELTKWVEQDQPLAQGPLKPAS